MGLFGSLFNRSAEKLEQEKTKVEVKHFEHDGFKVHYPALDGDDVIGCGLWLTLNEKNVKCKVKDNQSFDNVYIWEEEKSVRALIGDKILFEVTNRHKAYKELKPFFRMKARFVRFEEKEGEYGKFYKTRVMFDLGRD